MKEPRLIKDRLEDILRDYRRASGWLEGMARENVTQELTRLDKDRLWHHLSRQHAMIESFVKMNMPEYITRKQIQPEVK